jgi:Txe/YoeB family toxin of toxin-antitoxin system
LISRAARAPISTIGCGHGRARSIASTLARGYRGRAVHRIGKPEPLHGWPNTWSRRITGEHRLVYRVFGDRIEVIAARFHYR